MTVARKDVKRIEPLDPNDVDSLVPALAAKNYVRRQQARTHLVAMGTPAVPDLIRCLADRRRHLRWEAMKTLALIADPTSTDALIAALSDRDEDVRWLAAVGLAAIGRDGLRPLLRELQARADEFWLLQGAHHVFHALAHKGFGKSLRPVLAAIDSAEPGASVPVAAHAALKALKQ